MSMPVHGSRGFGSSVDVMANLSRRIDATEARFTPKIPNPPLRLVVAARKHVWPTSSKTWAVNLYLDNPTTTSL